MKKTLLLVGMILWSLFGMEAQTMPQLSTAGSEAWYCIRFKTGAGVLQDMGTGQKLLTKTAVENTNAQLWKVEATSPGATSYYLISKLGNKIAFDGSRFITNATGNQLVFTATTITALFPAWEIGRVEETTTMNQFGGAGIDKEIGEWSSDNNNPVEFQLANDYALNFNGTTDKLLAPSPFTSAPTTFTVEWWMKPNSLKNYNQTISATNGWGSFKFHTTTAGEVYVGISVASRIHLGGGTVETGKWQHFAFTYDNGTGKFYKNGELLANQAGMAASAAWTGFIVSEGNSGEFDGQVDDIRIWNTARSSSEILANASAVLAAQTNLMANYRFDDKLSTTSTDYSGKAKNATLTGCSYQLSAKPQLSPSLKVSSKEISLVSIANNSKTVDVTSNTNWTVESNQSWLTVSPTSGANNSTITFSATQNPTATIRTAIVTLSALGALSQIITLTQDGTVQTGDYALSLNGTTDKLVAPSPFTTVPTTYTVEWWMKPNSLKDYNQMISGNSDWGSFRFHTDVNGAVYVGVAVGSRIELENGTLEPNKWQHFAFTYDNGTAKFYKNGDLLATESGMTAPTAWTGLYVSQTNSGYSAQYDGMIDDLRVWNTARTSSEIQANISSALSNEANLVAEYRFDNHQANIGTDYSGKNNHATITGGTYVEYAKPQLVIKATNPFPLHGDVVRTDALRLEWQGVTGYTYDVYVGTSKADLAAATTTSPEFKGNISTTFYTDASFTMQRKTAYFWKIDSKKADGSIGKGTVWTFVYPDASLVALQTEFLKWRFGMFLHFNMGTFSTEEWAVSTHSPNLFNPTNLDCAQWADAAVKAGMKYLVLTAKHHDGFCLWDSKAITPTGSEKTYDVGSSSWRAGKGDVVKEYVEACRARNLKVGIYFSIWDRKDGENLAFVKAQLTELLTNYGNIDMLWFDGWGWQLGYGNISFDEVRNHIKSIQPNCIIMENNHEYTFENSDLIGYESTYKGIPPTGYTLPSESCNTIIASNKWFYPGATEANNLRTSDFLINNLKELNERSCNLLLDCTPDQRGLIPTSQVNLLTTVGNSVLTGTEKMVNNSVSISPNPCQTAIKITSQSPVKKVEIYSVTGKIIQEVNDKSTVQVSNLDSGLYLVKISTELGNSIHRIVKD